MPTMHRPEMLALSLEKLSRADNCPDDIRIFVDHTTDERLAEVDFVRDNYFPEATIFHAQPHQEVPSGMWNILHSLRQGYVSAADRIFLIEEDILVGKDFFNWHNRAQKSGAYLATCGRRMKYLPDYNQYTNPGSCFSRDMLAQVVEHINPDLFADRRKYMDQSFGTMNEISDLDDGLIRRIAKFNGLKVLYPEIPQCAHIGFRAYNHYMGWVNEGDIEQRISKLRRMLAQIDPNDRYTRDYEPPVSNSNL
jgi:hypothetical protein